MKRRVVVTGLGIVSPIGLNINQFTESLKKGVCGEDSISERLPENFPVSRGFPVKNFDAKKIHANLLDPFIQFVLSAAGEALRSAAFDPASVDPFRVGISVSSSKGGMHTVFKFRDRFVQRPSAILGARIYSSMVPNFAAQWVARRWKLKGPAKNYVAACATGSVAVLEGMRMVQEGTVDYCLAGASDASIVPLMLAGYRNMKALANHHMKPFSANREGFLVGEGAGILFLESLESAQARKATIYGEILGGRYGCDGTHPVHFSEAEHALSRTAKGLLGQLKLEPEDIDYVNLHGTATQAGDRYETLELKEVFGAKVDRVSMSATKSMTGHMLGASGAVEAITTLLAMKHGFIPPTVNLDEPDPDCDLNYTPQKAVSKEINRALSWSMGFGGQVAALAFQKVS